MTPPCATVHLYVQKNTNPMQLLLSFRRVARGNADGCEAPIITLMWTTNQPNKKPRETWGFITGARTNTDASVCAECVWNLSYQVLLGQVIFAPIESQPSFTACDTQHSIYHQTPILLVPFIGPLNVSDSGKPIVISLSVSQVLWMPQFQ